MESGFRKEHSKLVRFLTDPPANSGGGKSFTYARTGVLRVSFYFTVSYGFVE